MYVVLSTSKTTDNDPNNSAEPRDRAMMEMFGGARVIRPRVQKR